MSDSETVFDHYERRLDKLNEQLSQCAQLLGSAAFYQSDHWSNRDLSDAERAQRLSDILDEIRDAIGLTSRQTVDDELRTAVELAQQKARVSSEAAS